VATKATKNKRWYLIAGNNRALIEYEKAIKMGATKTEVQEALSALERRVMRIVRAEIAR
jgi:hypothetical protein